jgi:hypothetical protein
MNGSGFLDCSEAQPVGRKPQRIAPRRCDAESKNAGTLSLCPPYGIGARAAHGACGPPSRSGLPVRARQRRRSCVPGRNGTRRCLRACRRRQPPGAGSGDRSIPARFASARRARGRPVPARADAQPSPHAGASSPAASLGADAAHGAAVSTCGAAARLGATGSNAPTLGSGGAAGSTCAAGGRDGPAGGIGGRRRAQPQRRNAVAQRAGRDAMLRADVLDRPVGMLVVVTDLRPRLARWFWHHGRSFC